jgi:hypothetical protein
MVHGNIKYAAGAAALLLAAAPVTASVVFLLSSRGSTGIQTAYYDTFSGQSTDGLNGSAPDIRPDTETWTSNEKYKADGSFSFSSESTSARAWLPVTIEAGKIYSLELTGTLTPGGTSSQSIGVAFTSDRGDVGNNLLTSARMIAAIILRNNGEAAAFANANNSSTLITLASSPGNSISNARIRAVLSTYTDDTKWKADYYINDMLLDTYTWEVAPTMIARVAISTGTSSGNLAGTFDEFKLTAVSPSLIRFHNGKLVYEGYQNHNQQQSSNILPDFSHAGYRGGGVAIPDTVPIMETLDPAPGDDFPAIQTAIDRVSSRMPDTNGFRGTVFLNAGVYEVSDTIRLHTSGVVLRGAGQGTNGTVITHTGPGWGKGERESLIEAGLGSRTNWVNIGSTLTSITNGWVPTGSRTVSVQNSDPFSEGDRVIVRMSMNQAWINELGMQDHWTPAGYIIEYERTIVYINRSSNTVVLDVPLVQSLSATHCDASLMKVERPRIQNCGVEHLRLVSPYVYETDEENRAWYAVRVNNAEDSWVRNITALHFPFSCVTLNGGRRITVQDCAMLEPKSLASGGRRYAFYFGDNRTHQCLFQRCYSTEGRHDFVTGSRVPGPNVFLDCVAVNGLSDIGPHQRFATGTLFDQVSTDYWLHVRNMTARYPTNPHGWRGAQTVFWNCEAGEELLVDSPPGSMNFAIGCRSPLVTRTAGGAFIEHTGKIGPHVAPRSLYLQQLRDRLGQDAVDNVTTAQQRDGSIWQHLKSRGGDGEP